jgi:hypothetical protein
MSDDVAAVPTAESAVKLTPFALHDAAAAGDAVLLEQLLASLAEANEDEYVPPDDR